MQIRLRNRMNNYGYYKAGKRGTYMLYECEKCNLVFMSKKEYLPGEYICFGCRRLKNE